jgi:dTMP kinase
MKGKFITLEGCEGVGKSRQLKMLEDFLVRNEVKYYFTREPGGTDISEQIRKIILDEKNVKMTDECEAMLYASARIQLVKEEILPRVEKGELVVCDRYIDSSFAYQGEARGLGETFVKNINSFVMENCMPDLTLFLNLSPEQAFKRKGGVDKNDRLELSGLEFHQKVYNGYLNLAKKYPERIVVIDASGEKEQTHAKIIQALRDRGII